MIYKSTVFYALLSVLITLSSVTSADDTEIFFSRTFPYTTGNDSIPLPNPNYPNVLFILDASKSMSFTDDQPTSRLARLREAMNTILDSADDINIGVMRFSHKNSGGRVIYPMSPIEFARENVKEVVDTMALDFWTPTIGAMLEAAYYWQGAEVYYGRTRFSEGDRRHNAINFSRVSHPQSYTGGDIVRDELCTDENLNDPSCFSEKIVGDAIYTSPIVHECQANYQVLISDGEATGLVDQNRAESLTGGACSQADASTCGAELAAHLSQPDFLPSYPGENSVATYTVGFNASLPALELIATEGGGQYFESNSATELAAALSAVLAEVAGGNRSFVAPSITMDEFTRISHRDDMYMALFQPDITQRWSGNLKKYRYDGGVKDQNDEVAIDAVSGSFLTTAQSFWSDAPDGNSVVDGGAANRLDDITTRNVYTYTGTLTKDLTNQVNALSEYNTDLLGDMLEVPQDEVSNLLQWARGVDVDSRFPGDVRLHMGDPLHSRPVVLTYGGTADEPESVVFIGTNEGYLHAIDTETGDEIFSFVPPSLLRNLAPNYRNEAVINRIYGLDGDLTLWVNDADDDGELTVASDHAYLYMGMRRGGRNYTALDVTQKNTPKFLWSINAGDAGFEKLGQSWSRPTLGTIMIDGEATKVLIFGGGYDPGQDHATFRSADTQGNDLFIVDAQTGELLWSTASDAGSYSDMQYSIPSDVSIIDTNGDGYSDQIYVGDMGGQVWRFDIDNQSTSTSPAITGGVIAELSGISSYENRRFFNRPDVTLVENGKEQFLSVSIGSGNRAHPLQTSVNDRFYMIRQRSVFGPPEGYGIIDENDETVPPTEYRTIKDADLYDVSENRIDSADVTIADAAADALARAPGWKLPFTAGSGEKVLAQSLTVTSQVVFSTYVPEAVTSNVCAPAIGGGRSYSVSVLDGSPTLGVTDEERYEELEAPGIPPEPVPHIDKGGMVSVIVGMKDVATPSVKLVRRVYWSETPNF